jgi:hypothetical protein
MPNKFVKLEEGKRLPVPPLPGKRLPVPPVPEKQPSTSDALSKISSSGSSSNTRGSQETK